MTWNSPDSPWQRAQRKRVRIHLCTAIAAIVVGGGLVGGQLYIGARMQTAIQAVGGVRTTGTSWIMLLSTIMISVVMVAMAGYALWRLKLEREVLQRVPAHDGAICPVCRQVLVEQQNGHTCPKCDAATMVEQAREFWEQYPFRAGRMLITAGPMSRRTSLPGSGAWRFRKLIVGRIGFGIAWMVGAFLLFSIVASLSLGRQWWEFLLQNSWQLPMGLGFLFFARGAARRKEQGVYCSACEYELPPGEPGLNCPECGTEWGGAGGRVKGRLERSPRLLISGVVLLVLAMAMVFGGMKYGRVVTNAIKNTPALMQEIIDQPAGFNADAWTALSRRTLTPSEETTLLEGLLTKRDTLFLSPEADAWCQAIFDSGTMPPHLTQRYFGGPLEVERILPATAVAGVLTPLRLRLQIPVRPRAFDRHMTILIEGVVGRDFEQGFARADEAIDLSESGAERTGVCIIELGEFTVRESGPHPLQIALWVFYGPTGLARQPIAWKNDGTPIVPGGAIWSERLVLEHVVVIEEAPER